LSDKNRNNRNNSNNYTPDEMDTFFAEFNKPTATGHRHSTSALRSSSGSRSSSASAGRSRTASRSQINRTTSQRRNNRVSNTSTPSNKTRKPAPVNPKTDIKTSVSSGGGRGGSGSRSNKPVSAKSTLFSSALFCCLALIMAVGIYVGVVFMTAPSVDTDNIYSMLAQRSIMYDSEGNQIENLYFSDGNRTVIDYDTIPENMVNAVIAVEDKKFWKHSGFNFIRMAGAIKESLFGGGQISGTSTVTQQLARNVYLAEIKSQRSLSRKLSEMYCTIVLEKNLSKEEIMEAYLNTIYLGFNSYGIEAAAQAYFSKSAEDLTLLECASFAALPQSPDTYALVKADYYNSDTTLPEISTSGSVTYLYNGDLTADRRNMIIQSMNTEGFITADEMNKALDDDLQKHIKVGTASDDSNSSYFTDYAIGQLTDDIAAEYGISEADAQNMIYTGGLKIYTTMDSDIQSIVEEEFAEDDNFAGVAYVRTNYEGDILNSNGNILLYSYNNYFNENNEFVLKEDEFRKNSDGSITILSGKRMNIYEIEVNGSPDVSIEFKSMYTKDNGSFYFIESGALSIAPGNTTVDAGGNAVISADFVSNNKNFFKETDGGLAVSSDYYTLKQQVRQPQGAMVIIENSTGELKAMMGGRGTTGKQLFNRATSPRQPGSSIKPIGVYGPALQMSYEYEADGKTMALDKSDGSDWGKYITAGSVINDAALRYGGRTWPKNSYAGYKGHMRLRTAVENSVNVCAVKTYQQIGPDWSADMLTKVGISTLDLEGEVNDLNPAALALGGMTSGISPLELAAAYSTFPNGGEYKEPIAYTKVVDSHGETIFEKKTEGKQVYDEGVAWIMTDILRTTVSRGIAGSASIYSQPVGGKTGTTDDNCDAWFCGFTPQYSAALWMGTDVKIAMTSGSGRSAAFWSEIMSRVCSDIPRESFKERPANVISVGGEYYTDGTYSKTTLRKSKTTKKTTEKATTKKTTTKTKSTTKQKPTTTRNTNTVAPPTQSTSEKVNDPPVTPPEQDTDSSTDKTTEETSTDGATVQNP